MTDYQLDQVEGPQHHPATVAGFTGPPDVRPLSVSEALRGEGPNAERLNSSGVPVWAWQAQGISVARPTSRLITLHSERCAPSAWPLHASSLSLLHTPGEL